MLEDLHYSSRSRWPGWPTGNGCHGPLHDHQCFLAICKGLAWLAPWRSCCGHVAELDLLPLLDGLLFHLALEIWLVVSLVADVERCHEDGQLLIGPLRGFLEGHRHPASELLGVASKQELLVHVGRQAYGVHVRDLFGHVVPLGPGRWCENFVLKIIELRDANCMKLWNFHLVGTMNQNPLRNRETRNLLGNYSERVHCQSRRCCAHFRNLFCSFKETKFSWKKNDKKAAIFLVFLLMIVVIHWKFENLKKKMKSRATWPTFLPGR